VRGIVRYAIRLGKRPSEFSEDDLSSWGRPLRSYDYQREARSKFRRVLLESGLAGLFPGICFTRRPGRYGVPVRFFPAQLRTEVEALLAWKQDRYAEGRPARARLRAVTAKSLEECIARLYGFVTNIEKHRNITRLVQLVTKKFVASFIKWNLNERGLKGRACAVPLGLLRAAMKSHPTYRSHNFDWFRTLLSEIPPDAESEMRERKTSKYLPYEVLEGIPTRIRARHKEVGNENSKRVARLVHDDSCSGSC
jgi:hypothetical protein